MTVNIKKSVKKEIYVIRKKDITAKYNARSVISVWIYVILTNHKLVQ